MSPLVYDRVIAVDASGRITFADSGNNRIRRLRPAQDAAAEPLPCSTRDTSCYGRTFEGRRRPGMMSGLELDPDVASLSSSHPSRARKLKASRAAGSGLAV